MSARLRQGVDSHQRWDVFVEAAITPADQLPIQQRGVVAAPATLLLAPALGGPLVDQPIRGVRRAVKALLAAILILPHRLPRPYAGHDYVAIGARRRGDGSLMGH